MSVTARMHACVRVAAERRTLDFHIRMHAHASVEGMDESYAAATGLPRGAYKKGVSVLSFRTVVR